MVAEIGCIPVGPASSVSRGLDIVRNNDLDGAVLDINLGNERVWPVAEILDQRGIPFVLASGYSTTEVPERFCNCIILEKPLRAETLASALAELQIIQH